MAKKNFLRVVDQNYLTSDPLDDWLAGHEPRQATDLKVIAEAHEMLIRDRVGRVGIRVVANFLGSPVCEIGLPRSCQLTVLHRAGQQDIWNVAVKTRYNVKLNTEMLFHPMVTLNGASGLPKKRLYGCYADNHRRFAFWVDSPAKLITVAWQIGQQTK